MKNKLLPLLGLCKKAGKLLEGFDAVREAARKDKVKLIVLAEDISPKSRKEAEYVAQQQNIPLFTAPFGMDEIGYRLGKRAGILALTDQGLADRIMSIASRLSEEE